MKAEDESPLSSEKSKKKKKAKSKRSRSPFAFLSPITSFIAANSGFLLTWVLPISAVIVGVPLIVGLIAYRNMVSSTSEKLAEKFGHETRGVSAELEAKPYVRGNLIILETHGHVDYVVNDHIKPPLLEPDSIGSVILVEWKVRIEAARDAQGNAMVMKGFAEGEAVALRKWSCKLKLIDLKRKVVIHEKQFDAPHRTFQSGDKTIGTPTTRVANDEIAEEFDRIKGFAKIALNADPPR